MRGVASEFFISTSKRPTIAEAMPVGGTTLAHWEIGDTGTSRSRAAVYKLHRRLGGRKASAGAFVLASRFHPTLPTWVLQQVVSYPG